MADAPYAGLVAHYEQCFLTHGATPQGVDWPKAEDVPVRYQVMLDIARDDKAAPLALLDIGCGYGGLLDHLIATGQEKRFAYRGIELSEPMLHAARQRHPDAAFENRDLLTTPLPPQSVDYAVMNGVLTEKRALSFDAMRDYAERLIETVFPLCRKGLAFNIMSAHVDWQRDDLFHWPFDALAAFLKARCSRHMQLRADYGLYEYTVYVYREPNR